MPMTAPIREGVEVLSVTAKGDGFEIGASDGVHETDAVFLATSL
jgi:hypothetical protein